MEVDAILSMHRPRFLHVRMQKKGVWYLKLPWAPWNTSKAHHEREEIVTAFASTFPLCVLWQSAWARDGGEQSRVVSKDECLEFLKKEAYVGVWVLLFSSSPSSKKSDISIKGAAFDEDSLRTALNDTSAQVAIGSFYDDIEWLVVEAGMTAAN